MKRFFYIVYGMFFMTVYMAQVIDQPGTYTIGNDIQYVAQGDNDSIFIITSDDVILNLNGNTISQDSSDTATGLIGVLVDANVSNVTIARGTIKNLANGIGIAVRDGAQQVYVRGINVSSCDQAGILFDGVASGTGIGNIEIENCSVYSCVGYNGSSARGIHLKYVDNGSIVACRANNNDAVLTGSGYGIIFEGCSNCEFTDIETFDNGGNQWGIGMYGLNSVSCNIINSKSANNVVHETVLSSTAAGYYLEGCTSVSLYDCQATNNLNTSALGTVGGYIAINGLGNSFNNSIALGNIGGNIAAGYLMTATEARSAVLSCKAVVNQASMVDGTAYGVLLDNVQDCVCNETILGSNVGFVGIGLRDTVVDTQNLIYGNFSYSNTTTGYDVTRVTGTFPVVFASVGDFTQLLNVSNYYNVAIVP